MDADRKCFRMVGGVLVERTVKEVLPALTSNRDQVILCCPYIVIYVAFCKCICFSSDD